ncbi:MAG: GNAT family N-acetyltransferase [Oscillospiraceae bacterium]|jgi:RimJ/RimL family protein N-acetyltransferase|nr:GNAT family N-acetyltransferase [Oscillospiraceae bacterium]
MSTDYNETHEPTVSLREWQLSDAAALAEMLTNKKILDNLRDGLPYPYTEEDGEFFINSMLSADKNDTFAFAVLYAGEVVGSIGAFRQQNIHSKTAEVGYYIGEKHWGKGICSAAVTLLSRYVFENTDIIRLFAEPFATNAGSMRVLEKAGFEYEGTLRKNAVKNGKIIDMKMYSLIKPL